MWWIPISIVIVLLVILIISNVHIVQQSQAYVVTWLGQFHAIWNQGPHVKRSEEHTSELQSQR